MFDDFFWFIKLVGTFFGVFFLLFFLLFYYVGAVKAGNEILKWGIIFLGAIWLPHFGHNIIKKRWGEKKIKEQKIAEEMEEKKKLKEQQTDEDKLRKQKKDFVRKQKNKGLVNFIDHEGNEIWCKPRELKKVKEISLGLESNFLKYSPYKFEEFVCKLFKIMGYQAEVTQRSKDFGADVIAKKNKCTVLIQVKQRSNGQNIGNQDVQKTLGAMWKYKADKAIVVTNTDYTVEAESQARDAPIELWNGILLKEMVRKYLLPYEFSPRFDVENNQSLQGNCEEGIHPAIVKIDMLFSSLHKCLVCGKVLKEEYKKGYEFMKRKPQ